MKKVALLICGALGREVKAIVDGHGWDVDVYGVPAMHHFYPKKIVEAVDRRLAVLAPRYRQVVVVYGDCGTAGALDPVLARYGAVQLSGPHCYEMFAGADFARIAERAVVRGLGIDRYPELKAVYFQNYTDLLYLEQFADERLVDKAREIAEYLGLPLEVRHTGLNALETRLAKLVEAA
ncbi:MAG: DUF1638 domain-containing protein [Chloroflexi bacterium]|nr:MAG: DUF1638 domain-containing protein [Chloroflexota bacterium]